MRKMLFWVFVVATVVTPAIGVQANEDCLMCHEDPDLTGMRGDREIPMHVDAGTFAESVHGEFDCVMCHQDLDGVDLPHEDDVERVACIDCHDDIAAEVANSVHAASLRCAQCHGSHEITPGPESVRCADCHRRQSREHDASLHGQAAERGDPLAPSCVSCHGGHDVLSRDNNASPIAVINVPMLCGRCHSEGSEVSRTHDIPQDRILENYSMSIHGEGLFRQGLTVTAVCSSCHTPHMILPHTDPRSSIHRDNIGATCEQCHGQIEQVHRQVIKGRLWQEEPEKIPACVDCHSPHKIRRVFYPAGMANKDCLSCHADGNLTTVRDGETVSLFIDEDAFSHSMHAGTACAQCHTDVTASRTRPCETIRAKVDCSICHEARVTEYEGSTHGTLFAAGDPDAPTCLDCHDQHATQDNAWPVSPTYPRNVPMLCARCHRAGEKAAVRIEAVVDDIVGSYIDSIHGKGLLQSGLVVTATCANCHSAHGELPPDDPGSTVHRDNIATTCGTCHHGIEEIFRTSVHWPGNVDTDRDLPTCEDCHTSHTIGRTDRVDFRFSMMDQCGRCHETEAETFFDTYHGKVSRLGEAGAAKCYDCHGTHDILPTTDPESALSRDNVVATCGQCHEASHRRFAGYLTHATHHDAEKYPWLFWSFWLMTTLLVGTLTFALLHTLAWLMRLWLSRDQWLAHKNSAEKGPKKYFRRFNRLQRSLHFAMLLSFLTLAVTGMALKFSYMAWAQNVAWLLGGFATTGVLHRMGAVVLMIIAIVHLVDIWQRKKRDNRSWWSVLTGPDTIMFTLRDLKEVVGSIKWFFGIGPRPHYGRYTYWEKFDYFAVFWGILVIGTTGFILWFPETFTRLIPGWSVNVATIIHSDEALLAVGFIFTIHFFNTHFRPDKFPMDPVIFTGRVPVEELKFDKPAEYEELEKSGKLDSYIVEGLPEGVERGFKVFGFAALAVGLTVIALIVYTMLFGYR